MRTTRDDIMGMPITVELVGGTQSSIDAIFDYFYAVDIRFSTYKLDSEIMKINRGEIPEHAYSDEMKEVFALGEQTRKETNGFFSMKKHDGTIDPAGIVKGWAIRNAARRAETLGYTHYFIDAGGDIQSYGLDEEGKPWTIGIRNPFNEHEIVKVVRPDGQGVATSGTSIRGQHIYNPHTPGATIDDIVSTTVIGPDIYEADRFATAAFAMGKDGILFLDQIPGFAGYQIDAKGIATMTHTFEHMTV
ncbi:MAG: FAD:protein FMN transferase [Candidatus Magasanikbacteria bacterium CG_4_9_14_0_2_um_filter_41_10]|uniref:FAD:protein FMN transferase n=1 Tax=Candidatus Magasanikbacteria bacterium CG_4_10_14_0_2_um_filter_41_31 TaxID=1974639 RepID=A0A2M7V3F7_9BACT|nr:MAG: thiamine biosynthesis protein [Candidatus Magasanikbacteria bacterium CG1_02_41_34]PIZ93020.1 MAG: FAD:protein FMN transferase [Candidatus Magasanikbacteria bacterium CG_4_10_14_0_2_um_filter_41_31]PJC53355.1 MAG: FAD:protein FMN transferase [Candidatus Magasanikbacteria bacterium CG_4_9_14_0_2_um_filter_41_10]